MNKINIFFKWFWDIVRYHQYWYKEPPKFWKTENYGRVLTVPNTQFMFSTGKHPVKKKKCKYCGREVWSNNPTPICGGLKCWLKTM